MFDIREGCGFMDGYDCWVFEHWEFGGGKEVSIRCRREMWRRGMQLLAPERDIVALSALISGYTQNRQPNEAVKTFLEMGSRNVKSDEFLLASLMAALKDMNAKCGNMKRAMYLFEEMPKRDLIPCCSSIWETMSSLRARKIRACSISCWCMECTVSRSCLLKGDCDTLLAACKLYSDSEVVAYQLIELEPQNADNYVLLSNIYTAAERWLDVSVVRNRMNERGL
ncbi:putative pentatricopeptide repeat-containing protein, partial [Cucurbita argyrosperma subsp. sororia]